MTIQGIDVSNHQGEVDFIAVASAGFRFAYVKATEGTGHTDPKFREHWRNLRYLDGELHRGAYHFARPDSDGSKKDAVNEAKDFVAAIRKAGGDGPGMLPPALDFEKYSDNTPRENVPWVRAFVGVIEDEFGRPPVIYTGRNVWKYELGNSSDFIDCPLWLVRYSQYGSHHYGNRSHQNAKDPLPWPRWTFWQWSGGGKFNHHGPVPGVKGDCDVNNFSGTQADLDELAGIGTDRQVVADAGHAEAIQRIEAMHSFYSSETRRLSEQLEMLRGMA